MSLKKILAIVIIAFAGLCSSAQAGIITTLDFQSGVGAVGAALDNTVVGTPVTANITAIPGLTITAVGAATDAMADLNATGSGFGINSSGTDDSDGVETALGESISFSFNLPVTILDIEFENIVNSATSTEVAEFGGFNLPGTGLGTGDTFTFTPPLSFAAGAPILFQEISGDGVSLQFLTIEAQPVIPEPSSFALLGFGSFLMMARRRRR